jgi:hypothetical protein
MAWHTWERMSTKRKIGEVFVRPGCYTVITCS